MISRWIFDTDLSNSSEGQIVRLHRPVPSVTPFTISKCSCHEDFATYWRIFNGYGSIGFKTPFFDALRSGA